MKAVSDILGREYPSFRFCVASSCPSPHVYLPGLFGELVCRLRCPPTIGARALVSPGGAAHGILRRKQGYTAPMLVEESRMLEV
jgi:hypothetical protein